MSNFVTFCSVSNDANEMKYATDSNRYINGLSIQAGKSSLLLSFLLQIRFLNSRVHFEAIANYTIWWCDVRHICHAFPALTLQIILLLDALE